MSSGIRAHIRSNVVGYIALFCFAIGGTANALPGANTVQGDDIGPGEQVKNRDTKPIKSEWVADGSLTAADLADDSSVGTLEVGEELLDVGGDLSGTVADAQIGAGAVGAAEIASGSIGAGQIDTSQLQRRVDGTCPADSSVRTIAADGSVTCESDAGAVPTDLAFHITEQCPGDVQKFAVVASNGALSRSDPAAPTVTASRLTTGTYVVDFGAIVTGCAHIATVGQTASVGTSGPGLVTVAGRSGNANAVFVTTFRVQPPADS